MDQTIVKFFEKVDEKLVDTPSWLPCKKIGCCDGVAGCCRNSMYAMVTWLEMEYIYESKIKKMRQEERVEIYLKAYEQTEALKATNPEFFANLDNGLVADVAEGLAIAFKAVENKICPFLNQETNACGVYEARPLICRAFGQCASQKTNDAGEKEPYLIGCDTTFEASKAFDSVDYPNYAAMQGILFKIAAPSINGFRVQMIAKPLQFWVLDLADGNGDLTNQDNVFASIRQLIASRLQQIDIQTPTNKAESEKNEHKGDGLTNSVGGAQKE